MPDTAVAAAAVLAPADDLVDRILGATLGALELLSVHLGWRRGLYPLVADQAALTPAELEALNPVCQDDLRHPR